MTCSCRIPDPIVINGKCLVCYGERNTTKRLSQEQKKIRSKVEVLRSGGSLNCNDPLALSAVRFLRGLGPDTSDPDGVEKFHKVTDAMAATLRAQFGSPSRSPQNGNPPAGLRAERRPPAECDGGHVPGRRST